MFRIKTSRLIALIALMNDPLVEEFFQVCSKDHERRRANLYRHRVTHGRVSSCLEIEADRSRKTARPKSRIIGTRTGGAVSFPRILVTELRLIAANSEISHQFDPCLDDVAAASGEDRMSLP